MNSYDPNEPILRGEYEHRHQELRDKYETFAKRSTRILAILVFGLFLCGISNAYLLRENVHRTQDISSSLVKSCQESGNPLRSATQQFGHALIGQIQGDIDQGKTFEKSGAYSEFFPNIPPAKLHALLIKGREDQYETINDLRKAVKTVQLVDCEKKFPK